MIELLHYKYERLGWKPIPVYEDGHAPDHIIARLLASAHRSSEMAEVRRVYGFPGLEPTIGWRSVPHLESGRDIGRPALMLGSIAVAAETYTELMSVPDESDMLHPPGQASLPAAVGRWMHMITETEHAIWRRFVDPSGGTSFRHSEFVSVVNNNVVLAYAPDTNRDLYFTHLPPSSA